MSRGSKLEQRRAVETEITADALLAEVLDRQVLKLPAVRFRVEGSPAGNSFLLAQTQAATAQARYGGRVVEVLTADSLYREHAKGLGACAECHADVGHPCTEREASTIKVCPPHPVRLGQPGAVSEQRARELGPCPTCKVEAGRPCRTAAGRRRVPHRLRMPGRPTAPVEQLDDCLICAALAGQHCQGDKGRKVKPHRGRRVKAVP